MLLKSFWPRCSNVRLVVKKGTWEFIPFFPVLFLARVSFTNMKYPPVKVHRTGCLLYPFLLLSRGLARGIHGTFAKAHACHVHFARDLCLQRPGDVRDKTG